MTGLAYLVIRAQCEPNLSLEKEQMMYPSVLTFLISAGVAMLLSLQSSRYLDGRFDVNRQDPDA